MKDFNLDCLDDLRIPLTEVHFKGHTFYVRQLNALEAQQYFCRGIRLSSANKPTETENAMYEMTRIALMAGVVTKNGDPVFANEKQFKQFITKVPNELITNLESEVTKRLTDAEEEKKE